MIRNPFLQQIGLNTVYLTRNDVFINSITQSSLLPPSPLGEGWEGGFLFSYYSPKSRYTPIFPAVSVEMRLLSTITLKSVITPTSSRYLRIADTSVL